MKILRVVLALAAVAPIPASASTSIPSVRHENGIGPDPDGDGNPAVNTRGFMRIGDAAEAAFDPPYSVITFEAPPGKIGESLSRQYAKDYGVTFSGGLSRELCDGRAFGVVDTLCTYKRAPSGRFAAAYRDDWGAPLTVKFAAPICIFATAIYPTGGTEGEKFTVTLEPYAADGTALPKSVQRFSWTENTFRWRLMAGLYMADARATSVKVRVDSADAPKKAVRFLMDNLATVSTSCAAEVAKLKAEKKAETAELAGS